MSINGQQKAFVLFSGYNFRVIIALCRLFGRYDIPFGVVARSSDDPIFATRYADRVFQVRDTPSLRKETVLAYLVNFREFNGYQEVIVAPTSEYLNHFLLEHQQAFHRYGIRIPLVDKPCYQLITNKLSFAQYCQRRGIAVPAWVDEVNRIRLPCVAKPRINLVGDRTLYPYLIFDAGQLESFLSREDPHNFFFQEYIQGRSFYLFYYITSDGRVLRDSQENLAQQPDGKSIVLACTADLHHHSIADRFEAVLKELAFRGIVMIEVKQREDAYYLIEANPRFWGPFQLLINARSPLVTAMLEDQLHVSLPRRNRDGRHSARYLWAGGIVQALRSKKALQWYRKPHHSWAGLLFKELPNDVYFRPDTIRYFFRELTQHHQ